MKNDPPRLRLRRDKQCKIGLSLRGASANADPSLSLGTSFTISRISTSHYSSPQFYYKLFFAVREIAALPSVARNDNINFI